MKKLLFVALAATLLAAGCQKTEVLNQVNPTGQPSLSFSTGMGKLTKASGTADAVYDGLVNLQAQDFRVWAYCAYNDTNTESDETNTVYDGMENLLVSYTAPSGEATTGSWGTTTEYYWPGEGKALKFFAVSAGPEYIGTGSSSVTINDERSELTVTDFLINAEEKKYNNDLMVADFVEQHQGDKVVDLTFRHALTKVEFCFKTSSDAETAPKVFVQSVTVEGLANKGTLTVSSANTNSGESAEDGGDTNTYAGTQTAIDFTWTLAEGATVQFTDDWTTEANYVEGSESDVNADKTAMELTTNSQVFTTWLVLPQDIEGKKVTINYVINKRHFSRVFALDTNNLTSWEDNQYVKYNVVLAPNTITFNPVVGDWTINDLTDMQN